MTPRFTLRPTLLSLLALAFSASALAQSPPVKPRPAPRPAIKKKAEPPPPPAPVVLPPATEEQLAATERAHLGQYDCEFKQYINITRDAKNAGYIEVSWKNQVFTMKPVLSSTGALRLEDVTGRTLMIQIANKSMLLDTKIGQRLVDECIHPKQREAIEAHKAARAAAAAAGIAPEAGLGIEPKVAADPVKAAQLAATAAANAASAAAAAAQAASAAAQAASAAAEAASAIKP